VHRTAWGWLRLIGGAAILVVLGWRVGTGPFLDGIRTLNAWSLLGALVITAITTACAAWRWTVVASGLRVELPLRTAVAAYYRSQFLNSALPGGVVGDVHRGVRHGRDSGDIGRGLRAVAWERTAGQCVQTVLVVLVLLTLPSPVRPWMPVVICAAVAGIGLAALAARALPRARSARAAAVAAVISADVRAGLLDRRAWPAISIASVIVVAGHAAVFLIAARTVGVTAAPQQLLPLAMLALLAMSVPLSIGGWGPREGITAWAFGAAGLGVDRGIATATAYGVLAFVATLPGAIVLIIGSVRRGPRPAGAFVAPELPGSELADATHG
jgi:uncharacterized membrane protein YbhN (UPF0104 family)